MAMKPSMVQRLYDIVFITKVMGYNRLLQHRLYVVFHLH